MASSSFFQFHNLFLVVCDSTFHNYCISSTLAACNSVDDPLLLKNNSENDSLLQNKSVDGLLFIYHDALLLSPTSLTSVLSNANISSTVPPGSFTSYVLLRALTHLSSNLSIVFFMLSNTATSLT
ncbi:hypothetical protein ANAPH2_01098 [Anaplasma phagocytophilum]|nr:hypothetical protein ANAPH2_01098 [Anaplasma phagocytophilum]